MIDVVEVHYGKCRTQLPIVYWLEARISPFFCFNLSPTSPRWKCNTEITGVPLNKSFLCFICPNWIITVRITTQCFNDWLCSEHVKRQEAHLLVKESPYVWSHKSIVINLLCTPVHLYTCTCTHLCSPRRGSNTEVLLRVTGFCVCRGSSSPPHNVSRSQLNGCIDQMNFDCYFLIRYFMLLFSPSVCLFVSLKPRTRLSSSPTRVAMCVWSWKARITCVSPGRSRVPFHPKQLNMIFVVGGGFYRQTSAH